MSKKHTLSAYGWTNPADRPPPSASDVWWVFGLAGAVVVTAIVASAIVAKPAATPAPASPSPNS